MAKKPIKVTEVVLRDAHQSLLATRMTMDEMRPILPEMDKINYFSVEETAAGAAPVAAAAPAAPAAPKAAPAPAAAPKAAAGAAGAVSVKAPMPGNILDVKVSAGASVKAGDVLVILEAMKMENEILAPQDGTVASVNVNKGDTVNSGDVLVSMN